MIIRIHDEWAIFPVFVSVKSLLSDYYISIKWRRGIHCHFSMKIRPSDFCYEIFIVMLEGWIGNSPEIKNKFVTSEKKIADKSIYHVVKSKIA